MIIIAGIAIRANTDCNLFEVNVYGFTIKIFSLLAS
jgi:hypothetical protein